ncbi:MAG: methionyl-tRNA formyltransferase [Chloroflexi bacterium]|nr:methionyl-tRNA formyltransferase [Chloroflexota bacterium]
MSTRTVFMGSPDFALPALQALAQHYQVIGVVTQPDRPAGRGQALTPPPVKRLALALGIPVIQPRRLREAEAMAQLRAWAPELIVVAAFGQILKPEVLDLPRFGCINVHASLLPRWRGAAPIQAAILAGDAQTGITIMRMDAGIDTGPILHQRAIPIQETDTAGTLSARLAALGGELLIETLQGYLNGEVQPRPQAESGATYAPLLKKEDGQLDFDQPAEVLARRVRAFSPWPGAFTFWKGEILKIHRAHAAAGTAAPGRTVVCEGTPAFGTSQGLLVLDEVQPAGKKAMPGKVFLQGAREWVQMDS